MKRLLGDKSTLAGLASRALGWSFFSTAFARLGTLGIGVLLARLLGPNQFGIAAVAYVALLAVLSFNELGVSLAIVRWPGKPDEIAPTVATISVATSLLLYAGLFFSAPPFSAAMGAPTATSVVRVMALIVVVNGIVSVPAALMERYFIQGRKMIADQVHGWLGAAVSVGLAIAGFGAMSLAIGQVVGAVVGGFLLVLLAPLRLKLGFSAAKARKLLKFGLPLAGSSLIVFLVGNVDNFVVGRMLGATALGFYVLAWNLASWPVNMFSQPVRSVAPAMFSRLQQDPPAMRTSFASTATLLAAVTLPVCLLISGSAVPLIRFVYGTRWVPAAQALMWLALLGALRILFELTYDYFVVLAQSRVVFTVQLAWLLALIPSLIAGAWLDGIRGVAAAGVAVAALVILPWYLIELRRTGVRLSALASGLWLPLVAAGAVGLAASAAAEEIPSDFAACMISGIVALATIGLLVYCKRPAIKVLKATLSRNDGQPDPALPDAKTATGKAGNDARTRRQMPAFALRAPRAPGTPDPTVQAAGLEALLAIAVPVRAYHDRTWPSPAYREDMTKPPPPYQEVATSAGREPFVGGRSGHSRDPGRKPESEFTGARLAESATPHRCSRHRPVPGPLQAMHRPTRQISADPGLRDDVDGQGESAHEWQRPP